MKKLSYILFYVYWLVVIVTYAVWLMGCAHLQDRAERACAPQGVRSVRGKFLHCKGGAIWIDRGDYFEEVSGGSTEL